MSTFMDLVSDVQDRLSVESPESAVRIGKAINRRYKAVTSSIGLDTSRRETVQVNSTIGSSQMTVPGVEKILAVIYREDPRPRPIYLVSMEELRDISQSTRTIPRNYAIVSTTYNSVFIELDCVPDVVFPLYIDGLENISILNGQQRPLFAESFHDILFWGALADEYLKLEKPSLAQDAELKFNQRVSDLRMFIARNGYNDVYPNKNRNDRRFQTLLTS